MKSELELALERGRRYARGRGWREEPLTWQEIELLVDAAGANVTTDYSVGYDVGFDKGFESGKAAVRKEAISEAADAVVTAADRVYERAGWIGVRSGYRSVPHNLVVALGSALSALRYPNGAQLADAVRESATSGESVS